MNLSELKAAVATQLDDPNFGYFTESIITRYLNNAQREVQKYLMAAGQNWYNRCQQTPTVENACAYYLPSDFLKMQRVELVMSGTSPNEDIKALDWITLNQQDMIPQGPGVPCAFNIQKDTIKLWPVADSADYTLRITYSYRISDMVNNTDVPDVPEEFHEMIEILATRTGYLRDDRPVAELDAKIDEYKRAMKVDAADRTQTRARRIVTTKDYDGGYTY